MLQKTKFLIILLVLTSWPLNLFFANTLPDFAKYSAPLVLLSLSFWLYMRKHPYHLIPSLLIPIFEPKLAIFPVILFLIQVANAKEKKIHLVILLASLIIFGLSWKSFKGQTIFVTDYQARQEVLRNISLYPSPFFARVFQNKARIYLDKFTDNLFAITDPNNYFFAFHPREITITNQNLDKYPFLSIIFFLAGLYFIKENPNKKFIISSSISAIISLSLLTNFDRQDFILWLPVSLVIIWGIEHLLKKKGKYIYLLLFAFILFSLVGYLRNYLTFIK